MAWIDGLTIPPGLEEAWNRIFNFLNLGTQNNIVVAPRIVSRRRYPTIISRSLIILWQPLYNSFTSLRRGHWDTYWGTLPFGSHSGANGWPGSGFSAFIYVNAPRYRLGMPLLYEPPGTYPNLIPPFPPPFGFPGYSGTFQYYGGNIISSSPFLEAQSNNLGYANGQYLLEFTVEFQDKITHAPVNTTGIVSLSLSSFQSLVPQTVHTGRNGFVINKSGADFRAWFYAAVQTYDVFLSDPVCTVY